MAFIEANTVNSDWQSSTAPKQRSKRPTAWHRARWRRFQARSWASSRGRSAVGAGHRSTSLRSVRKLCDRTRTVRQNRASAMAGKIWCRTSHPEQLNNVDWPSSGPHTAMRISIKIETFCSFPKESIISYFFSLDSASQDGKGVKFFKSLKINIIFVIDSSLFSKRKLMPYVFTLCVKASLSNSNKSRCSVSPQTHGSFVIMHELEFFDVQ